MIHYIEYNGKANKYRYVILNHPRLTARYEGILCDTREEAERLLRSTLTTLDEHEWVRV